MAPADDPTSIGSLLLAAKLVTQSQLSAAMEMKKVMSRLPLGQIFVRFGGDNQPFPKIEEHQIEALLAQQDHGRAKKRPLVESGAAIRALEAAGAAMDAHSRTVAEGGSAARKITLNEDLGEPVDASQQVGDE